MRDLSVINNINVIVIYINRNESTLLERILIWSAYTLIINENKLRRSSFLLIYK